jgi:pimeloyl-ACP methyl ester carboxylesterase
MPETTITSADGTKLAASCSGHGSPMVLVHGALGDVDTFALIEGLLAERHSVWAYSRRGRGGSGDGRDYTFEREVDDVLAVLAAAGDRAHLVGHSFGAVCCLLAATRSPSLRSLVLYEPPLRVDRMDTQIGDDIQAALAAGDPDRALEIFFTVADIVDAEAQVLRSLEPVWDRLRAGVRYVPREGHALLEAADRKLPGEVLGGADHLPAGRSSRLVWLRSFTTEARCSGDIWSSQPRLVARGRRRRRILFGAPMSATPQRRGTSCFNSRTPGTRSQRRSLGTPRLFTVRAARHVPWGGTRVSRHRRVPRFRAEGSRP